MEEKSNNAAQEKIRKQKTKEKKEKTSIPTSFKVLPNGQILEQIYDPVNDKVMFAHWDGKAVRYFPCYSEYVPINSDNIRKKVVLLPSEATDYNSDMELSKQIMGFIHRYADVGEFYEKLASNYVRLTWVYDKFSTVPYLRALGETGCGKTRTLQTIGFLCYKPMWAGGATTSAPIFRIIERWKGTLILDEADFKMSDVWADIIKILNCGFQKGFPVLRCNVDKNYDEEAYDVYCPKLLATRRRFKDKALEGRCLTAIMTETDREDITTNLPPEFWEEALEIRNKLLMWRFKHYNQVKMDYNQKINAVEPRINQIIQPIIAIIQDPKMKTELTIFIQKYNREIVEERAGSLEGKVVHVVVKLKDENKKDKPTIKEIKKQLEEDFDENVSSQKLGARLKGLGFESQHTKDGNYIIVDCRLLTKLRKRYIVEDEEVKSVKTTQENIETTSHIEPSPFSSLHQRSGILGVVSDVLKNNGSASETKIIDELRGLNYKDEEIEEGIKKIRKMSEDDFSPIKKLPTGEYIWEVKHGR